MRPPASATRLGAAPSAILAAGRFAIIALVGMLMSGCSILGFGGAMIESYRRSSTKTVDAEYKGLQQHNWAVVIIADRSIQAEFPDLVPWMTGKISDRLEGEQSKIIAAGMVPPERVLRYQYDHPAWVSMPYSELARELQVDRLIVVEIMEYRLNNPGNQYLWAGVASGVVGVVETDAPTGDEFAFEKTVRVRFPDDDSYGPSDMDRPTVATALGQRFLDRVTWLFYSHQEPYYPKY